MNVFVTGGSGYVGGYVLRALRTRGHRAFALARSRSAAERVTALGAEPISGTVTERGSWLAQARAADAIVHLAIPPPERTRRFYEWTPFSSRWVQSVADFESRALPLLFEAATGSDSVRAVVTTTGPAAAGHHGDSWIDEDARGPASSFGGVQRAVEERTLEAAARGIPAVVLRPGAVYGPDGGFAARVLRAARRGRVVYAGDGRNYVSWVHIEDYAVAYERAASGAGTGHVIAVVDDEPFTSREAMTLLAELAGAKAPLRIPVPIVRALRGPVIAGWATQSARVHNERAGRLLGWRPTRPSIRGGFREVLASFEEDQRGPRADREQRAQARPSADSG